MQVIVEELDLRHLDPKTLAVFLDFDGTLADIADHPSMVAVDRETKSLLQTLDQTLNGALAVISGRPITEVDRMLTPLRLPVAGVHGFERRDFGGVLHSVAIDEVAVAKLADELQCFAADLPGIFVERKPGAVALHYRGHPKLEKLCLETMRRYARTSGHFEVLHGKMVIEAKAGSWSKADAVAAFMSEAPFKGRLPLFAGDDVTDEAAFAAIAEQDGISIKVGQGKSCARYRAATPAHFLGWLGRLNCQFAKREL